MSDVQDSYSGFRLERDGPVLTCLFNRPEKLNAYHPDIYGEITRMCAAVGPDRDIRVVIVSGEGKAFCVGGDVKKFASGETDSAALVRQSLLNHTEHRGFLDLPQPTIAMINGDAIGGGFAFALQCDILVAGASARIGFGYSQIGMSPSSPLLAFTPLLTSLNFVKEYMFTGELVPAEEAYRIGLVNHLYSDAELKPRTEALAARIAAASPVSTRFTKLMLNKEVRRRALELDTGGEALLALSAGMDDFAEGKQAFVEHRKPNFPGS
jgi:enoyl-CoA hydratase